MVNTARQGADLERLVINHLEPFGYDSIRSAASKGAVDIVAVAALHPAYELGYTRMPLFIQCKLRNALLPPAERLALQNLALRAGAVPVVAYRPPGARKGTLSTTPAYRQLTGPGPKDWILWTPGDDD